MEASLRSMILTAFPHEEVDIRTYSPAALAFLGDAIYSLVIRTILVSKGNRQVEKLHNETTYYVRAEQQAQRQQEYVDNSLYYAMNPFHRGVSRVTLYVDADTPIDPASPWLSENPQASIVMAYTQSYPFDSDILQNIQTIMGTDAELTYIAEMVRVSNLSDPFVGIRVYHDDAEVAHQVTDYLIAALYERVSGNVGEFSANVVGYFVGYEVDWSMNDNHNSSADNLLNAQRAVTNAQDSLQSLQTDTQANREQAVEDARTARNDAEKKLKDLQKQLANTTAEPKNIIKRAVRYGVIFLFLGLVLGCAVRIIAYIAGGKLQDISSFVSRYSFPLIGVLPDEEKRWFMKAIRKLEGEPDNDYESAGKTAAQSLFALVNDRRAGFVSTLGKDGIEPLLSFCGEHVTVCGDIITDPEAVKTAEVCDSFVLVEKRGASRTDLVDSEVRRIQSLGKKVEGIILL